MPWQPFSSKGKGKGIAIHRRERSFRGRMPLNKVKSIKSRINIKFMNIEMLSMILNFHTVLVGTRQLVDRTIRRHIF